MSRNDDNSSIILIVCGVVALVVYVMISDFSQLLSLDMPTGFAVAVRLAFLGFLLFLSQKDYLIFRLEDTWPIFLALLWFSGWPALDFWANKDTAGLIDPESVSIWWDTSYCKWGVLVGLAGVGYLLKKVSQEYVNR
jgi:hypothetical protein